MTLAAVVTAISDELVALLASGGYTPLVDGRIVVGPQHIHEHSSPPRVVVVPSASTFGPVNAISPVPSASGTRAPAQRSLMSEWVELEFNVWGASSPPDADVGDYDATRTLYHQVLRCIEHQIGPAGFGGSPKGIVKLSELEWAEGSDYIRLGRLARFTLAFSTPVLDTLEQFAPADAELDIKAKFDGGADPPIPILGS